MSPAYLGASVSPFEAEEWIAATGVTPDILAVFESWDRQRTIEAAFTKAAALGVKAMQVTWEPWAPTPLGTSGYVQGLPQPKWSNEAIARGDHDAYIRAWARTVRDCPLERVYIRFGHEMDGGDPDATVDADKPWYPWSYDPLNYRRAWKRITQLFREQYRAKPDRPVNVRWVWAPNASLYRNAPAWARHAMPYWPGEDQSKQVDVVGLTMLDFGPPKDYTVKMFRDRLYLLHVVSGLLPVMGAEVNVALDQAPAWLGDLTAYVRDTTVPIEAMVVSQGPSRGVASGSTTGVMDWSFMDYPDIRPVVEVLQFALRSRR